MISNVKKSKPLVPAALVLAFSGILAVLSCLPLGCSGETETITYGAIPSGSAALVYIAQDRGFFRDDGLNVTVKDYPTGVATTDALLAGEVDVAFAAEFPMLSRAFAGEEISIFFVSSRFSDQYLFGLKDRGINGVSDLEGKTIGAPLKTIAEFYLARFLELNGIDIEDVSLVNVLPPQSVEAISGGEVDGVVTWEPYTSRIIEQMADSTMAWSIQSSQAGFGANIGRNEWLRGHPELVQRFLKSLMRAEDFLVHNPGAAKDIIQSRVNYDDVFMEIFWSENQFGLRLDRSLIIAMEDEARWMIASNLTTEKQVPDFLDYIYEDALKKLKPEAVDIIR
jgi:ABC-type nitrate/sulfonate/bicarbonate transport system substrate-binding protein